MAPVCMMTRAELKYCKQETTITEIKGLTESWLTSFFIAGLNEGIWCELLVAQAKSYFKVVSPCNTPELNYCIHV